MFPAWHFCLPHLLQCTFGSAAGSSAGATVHWCFAHIQYISQWGGSGLWRCLPATPAAALTGVPSPNSCPSSVATTSSLPSLPPPPAPWLVSSGLSQLSQQLGEAGLRTFPRSPCILLLRDGWSRQSPISELRRQIRVLELLELVRRLYSLFPWHSQLNNEGLLAKAEPLGEILGTREGVIHCPHEEAEPRLRSSPDICPGYDPVNDVLPLGPCSLFALGNSLDEVTVLFHSWDLFHHHGLPLIPCGFGPKLDWLSPVQPCSAVLDSSHDLIVL